MSAFQKMCISRIFQSQRERERETVVRERYREREIDKEVAEVRKYTQLSMRTKHYNLSRKWVFELCKKTTFNLFDIML
jgi:hypothetical protein